MKDNIVVIFVTSPITTGKKIALSLLDKKLVACVNEIRNINSFYWWENKICKDKESLLIIKTNKKKVNKVVKEIKKIHPYKVPEIIVLPVSKCNKEYALWVNNTVM